MNNLKWDAVLRHPTIANTAYFFRGSTFYSYNYDSQTIDSNFNGVDIGTHWPGIPDALDCALNHPTDSNKIYFFKAPYYYRYDVANESVDSGYPQLITKRWGGLPEQLDAALNHPTNPDKIYFFKGYLYYRVNRINGLVDSGYPKNIADIFRNLPHDLDAAVSFSGDNQVHFFKGDNHYEVSWVASNAPVVTGYPKSINTDWPGLPTVELLAGPTCGSISDSEASIWLWCAAAFDRATYTVELNGVVNTSYQDNSPSYNSDATSQALVNAGIDEVALGSDIKTLDFTSLSADTVYTFVLKKFEVELASLSFKTGPSQTGTTPTNVKLVFGSCSDTTVHGDVPVYTQMSAQNADLLLLGGDNSYYYNNIQSTTSLGSSSELGSHDWSSAHMMLRRQLAARRQSEFGVLMQTTPVLSTWDDHDFGYNNANGHQATIDRDLAANVYRAMWNHPYLPISETAGLYYKKIWGHVEIFMTDGRYDKNKALDPDTLLGQVQVDWLIAGLRSSTALLKIVVFSGRMLKTTSGGSRTGEGLTTEAEGEYTQIKDALQTTTPGDEIKGRVLILSGDIHFTDCYTMDKKKDSSGNMNPQKVIDVTSSPIRVNGKHATSAVKTDSGNQRLFNGNGESFAVINIVNIAPDPLDATQFAAGSQIDIQILDGDGEVVDNRQGETIRLTEKCHTLWDLSTGEISFP